MKEWDEIPAFMRIPEVRPYYDALRRKRGQLFVKRIFDLTAASFLLLVLAVPMLVIAAWIKFDSAGPVLFRQVRVTSYGRKFRIHKFRTMVEDAQQNGSGVTVSGDSRITGVGKKLRHARLDELPQLFDVLRGDMSFVGTRPESVGYVKRYRPEYFATLLMPAGITSEASIRYKDEDALLKDAEDADRVYVEKILPEKMRWNLRSIRKFGIFQDIKIMVETVFAVL